ncbi:MAG: hypothetical protein H8D78_02885 [Chloroflexi bacterium]|nr:hypothetical protein [Chloroflexota bacterium]
MFPSLEEYELFVYSIPDTFPGVEHSTLVVIRLGAGKAIVEGEVAFARGIRLRVFEAINFNAGVIRRYSYEVYHGEEQLYWYDSWPHPHIPELASTHPHHKHVPPDLKHTRVPAPELSFEKPNLLFIIEEIERTLLGTEASQSS